MIFLVRTAAVLASLACACLLGIYAFDVALYERMREGPGRSSPAFELVVGARGLWEIEWPAGVQSYDPADRTAFSLVVDPPVDAAAIDVELTIDPVAFPCHSAEWMGAPTQWMSRGNGTLPAPERRPLAIVGRAHWAAWTVTRVGPTAQGARARIELLGAPWLAAGVERYLRVDALVLLPVAIALGFLALRCASRGWEDEAPGEPSIGRAPVAVIVVASVVILVSLAALPAAVVARQALLGRITQETPWWHAEQFALVANDSGARGTWRPVWREPPGRDDRLSVTFHAEPPLWADAGESVLVSVDPPEAATLEEPGRSPVDGAWRLRSREDPGARLVLEPRLLRSLSWRAELPSPASVASLHVRTYLERRERTDEDLHGHALWTRTVPAAVQLALIALLVATVWRMRRSLSLRAPRGSSPVGSPSREPRPGLGGP